MPTQPTLGDLATLGGVEAPGPWESMGRGVTDLYEPFVQAWYNMTDAQRAATYRALTAENERLYQRGLAAGAQQNTQAAPGPSSLPTQIGPTSPSFLTPDPNAQPPAPSDPWRAIGKWGLLSAASLPFTPTAALALTPESVMGAGLTGSVYQALGVLAQKLGLAQ